MRSLFLFWALGACVAEAQEPIQTHHADASVTADPSDYLGLGTSTTSSQTKMTWINSASVALPDNTGRWTFFDADPQLGGHGPGVLLPPAEPDPVVAPILGSPAEQGPPVNRSVPVADRPEVVVKIFLGLLLLMALAYLGGDHRVLDLEAKLGISQVITTGLPFILLGMIARLPSVGILTDAVLVELSPLLRIGLGTVGFVAGFRFDARLFQGLPKGAVTITALSTLIPAGLVAVVTAPLLLLFSGESLAGSLRNPVFVRDALILATAGAMTAGSALRLLDSFGPDRLASRIIGLEELVGVLGIAIIAAFFRQSDVDGGWHLPGMAWFLLTVGLGATLGLLFFAVLHATPAGPDFLAVTLGVISFVAGAAGYLNLSSVAVAFVAGVILANFSGTFQPRLREMLNRVERPIYLLALFVIGALWHVSDGWGWVLMPIFMSARLVGKWFASVVVARGEKLPMTQAESKALAISPIGELAIVIVVNAQLLYPGGSISRIVSAVIGGGVLTEAFVQWASRRKARPKTPTHVGLGPKALS